MIVSNHVHHSPSRTISYPINSELAPCFPSQPLAYPPTPSARGHKHSLSKPAIWLGRSSSSISTQSAPQAAPKPTRISEPRVGSSLEQLSFHRAGPLGSGATIVRTPQEALSGPHHLCEQISEEGVKEDVSLQNTGKNESRALPEHRTISPPLPPLPGVSDEGGVRLSGASTNVPLSDHDVAHHRSSGSTSSVAHVSVSKPTLVAQSRAPSRSVPTPPVDADMNLPQPPFEAILLSPIPDGPIDPSKLIVTLETCTTTYRTTLRSLASRTSHLSRYITSLLSPMSETASMHSNASDASLVQDNIGFNSIFRDHLASSGCLPPSLTGIHIFLDRPSAPYEHVLAYLRSIPSTPEQPETLPRAVRLEVGSTSPLHLESLLQLCDEAIYLGLAELEDLCRQEVDRFHHCPRPTAAAVRGGSSLRGKVAGGSVHSFHTVVEEWEHHHEAERQKSDGNAPIAEPAARKSSLGSSCENKDARVRECGRERRGVNYEVGPPPPGWI